MNPMDNAEITSQMAQISTVDGITQLNKSIAGLSSQLVQMQMLQGASLVGHDVIVPGNLLAVTDGIAQGGFELSSAADSVKVDIPQRRRDRDRHHRHGCAVERPASFGWPCGTATDAAGLRFRVTAMSGATSSRPRR